MKIFLHIQILAWVALFCTVVSCTTSPGKVIPLASFTENDVDVSISLVQESDGKYAVLGTFTPPDGYHLYSKDIPTKGIDGLGRPTLIELTPNSRMRATGSLIESVKSRAPDFEPRELEVYPAGPVRLSLPVEMPSGKAWIDDEISITYMACSASKCKPPMVQKIVKIRIPAAEITDDQ